MIDQNTFFNRNNTKIKLVRMIGKLFAMLFVLWLIFGQSDENKSTYIPTLIILLLVVLYCYVIYPIVNNIKYGDVKSFKDLDITSIAPAIILLAIITMIIFALIAKSLK